jgi:hypothetical protein
MIRLLSDMPPGVLGLEAVDDVEREDYERVMVPAIEAAIAEHGKIRLVYVLGREFDEYDSDAVWEDVKLGARHPASFERMALVTDARWAGPALKVFSVLWPGKARAFPARRARGRGALGGRRAVTTARCSGSAGRRSPGRRRA